MPIASRASVQRECHHRRRARRAHGMNGRKFRSPVRGRRSIGARAYSEQSRTNARARRETNNAHVALAARRHHVTFAALQHADDARRADSARSEMYGLGP